MIPEIFEKMDFLGSGIQMVEPFEYPIKVWLMTNLSYFSLIIQHCLKNLTIVSIQPLIFRNNFEFVFQIIHQMAILTP